MNKDNKVLLISAVALVAASVGAHFTDKANEGFPTSLPVAQKEEFVAESSTVYNADDSTFTVKVRTNAPNGSIVKISAQHPYTSKEMETYAIVKNGKAKGTIDVDSMLTAAEIPVFVELNMEENQLSPKAVALYGEKGENLAGENVSDNGNGYSTVSLESEKVIYPNEQAYKNQTFDTFVQYLFVQSYGDVFSSIKPAEDGSWNEINITLTENMSSDESWSTMTDDVLNGFYDMFQRLAEDAEVIEKGQKVKITFYSNNGDVLAQNY